MMTREEAAFLRKMDRIEKLQKNFKEERARQNDIRQRMVLKAADKRLRPDYMFDLNRDMQNNYETSLNQIKNELMEAARFLGYNARFLVWFEREEFKVVPKNGSAQRMLTRYEQLYTMRELGGYETEEL